MVNFRIFYIIAYKPTLHCGEQNNGE